MSRGHTPQGVSNDIDLTRAALYGTGMTLLFENSRLVLQDGIVAGWLAAEDGSIAEIGEGRAPERGIDLKGDFLIPGLVELHTDNLEGHVKPRPMVRWHLPSAVQSYDAQIASAGITTVFDSLRVGTDNGQDTLGSEAAILADAIAQARDRSLLRAEHLTHLRCEVCAHDVIETAEAFLSRHKVHLLSLMDHTPGQRQFRDIDKLLAWYRGKGQTDEVLAELMEEKRRRAAIYGATHRRQLTALARTHAIPIASHDDSTGEEVAASVAEGATIAEFPVTLEAAQACRASGVAILMGAPNLVRGGSHSGNVAAKTLAEAGCLDILSSDYVPGSLIQAAFDLPHLVPGITLPQAIATVTRAPAEATGLLDRGVLAVGRRADVVRVHLSPGGPVVRSVWRAGDRVA
jgi:alpha-D-ribose 1-methylphosphonate 5-triphosphate diphosphatase